LSGSKTFILTEKIYKSLITRGMDLRCKCCIGDKGVCNIMLVPHDKIISKPSKKKRKYYLYEHYLKMMLNGNGNGDEVSNGEVEEFFKQ